MAIAPPLSLHPAKAAHRTRCDRHELFATRLALQASTGPELLRPQDWLAGQGVVRLPERPSKSSALRKAAPRSWQKMNIRQLRTQMTESAIVGHVYELRGPDAVVEMQTTGGGSERRLIDARQLRQAGILYEGQPFVLRIREYRRGNSHWWETKLRAAVSASRFAPMSLRPRDDFARFARLG